MPNLPKISGRTLWNNKKRLFVILFLVAAVPVTVTLVKTSQELRRSAQTIEEAEVLKVGEPEFSSNELLVKIKSESRSRINIQGATDTGISNLNAVLKQNNISSFSKAFNEGAKSDTNSEVFSWYLLITDDEPKKIKVDSPEADKLLQLKSELAGLSDVEEVEPNYIYYLLQDPSPTPPLSCPTNFSVACGAAGTDVTISWDPLSGAERYVLRVNKDPYGDWFNGAGGDQWHEPFSSPFNFSIDPDANYKYDVQGVKPGESYPYAGCRKPFDVFNCPSPPPSTPTPTPTPTKAPTPTPIIEYPISLTSTFIPSDGESNNSIRYDWEPAADPSSVLWIFNGECKIGTYGPGDLRNSVAVGTKTSYTDSKAGIKIGDTFCAQIWKDFFEEIPESNPAPITVGLEPTPYPLTPDDPYFQTSGTWGQNYDDLWGIKRIYADSAWPISTGSENVVVAVIDTGIDREHEDLKENMWVNVNEIPDNDIDDDANGYIDDYHGWDFTYREKDTKTDTDPMDNHGHGTHVAGTIGAIGNNAKGVVGINWRVKLMPVNAFNASGSGTSYDIARAHIYAADNGAMISSNSYGGLLRSNAVEDTLKYAHEKGIAIIAAAGNESDDALNYHPALSDYVVTVGATDPYDNLASFSNIGEKIDIVAPGVDILSARASLSKICTTSIVGENYCRLSGTSMATPHVSGLSALILANNPGLTNEDIRQVIRLGASDLGATGKDENFGYGLINASKSLQLSPEKPLSVIITSPKSRSEIPRQNTLLISGTATGDKFDNYKIEAAKYEYSLIPMQGHYTIPAMRTPTDWVAVTGAFSIPVQDGVLGKVDMTRFESGFYTFKLTATDTSGKTYQYQIFDIRIDRDGASGWPKEFDCSFPCYNIVPVLADINGDGAKEIIISATDGDFGTQPSEGRLHVYNKDGSYLPGFPVEFAGDYLKIFSPMNASDLDGDGKKEIIFSVMDSYYKKFIYVIGSNGEIITGWPKTIENVSGYRGEKLTPSIADIDGDSQKEIVLIDGDNKIQAFNHDGSSVDGFPKSPFEERQVFVGQISLLDLDSDNKPEMAVGKPGEMYLFDNAGNILPGWPYEAPLYNDFQLNFYTAPTMGDLDGDGANEIIAVATEGVPGQLNCGKYPNLCDSFVYAWKKNGELLPGWPKESGQTLDKPAQYGPTSANVDIDNQDEVLVGLENLEIYDVGGKKDIANPRKSDYQPVLSDLDGDGQLEIFTAQRLNNHLTVVKLDGSEYWKTTLFGVPLSAGVVADMDNNGKMEVAVVATTGEYFNFDDRFKVYLWELPGGSLPAKFGWPMYGHDPARTGSVPKYPLELISSLATGESDQTTINYEWDEVAPPSSSLYIWNGAECKTPETGYEPGDLLWSQPTAINTSYIYDREISAGDTYCSQIWINFAKGIVGSNPSYVTIPPPTTITPIPPLIPGDINGDGVVNILDFQILNNAFGTDDPDSDLNGDGIVNILDFQILSNNFGNN